MKIYVLLYEGNAAVDVGSKYASDELQHENIVVCLFIACACSLVPRPKEEEEKGPGFSHSCM